MIRACVIGWPITHSRSPLIHGHWLQRYGIAGSYVKQAVRPDDVAAFLRGLREAGVAGCNVTIPHKEAAYAAAEIKRPAAQAVGAANTLWFQDGRLVGENSDSFGFINHLGASVPGFDARNMAVAVLGAGGGARAIIHAVLDAGAAEVRVFNRTRARAEAVARHFGSRVKPHDWASRADRSREAGVLVNATSLGMHGGEPLHMDLTALADTCIVTDIVYVPLETPLLKAARARGLAAVDGLGMLLHQAVPGFEKWFGVRPEVTDALRAIVAADIEGGMMLVIGLTGSIGMGKSTVAARLRSLGIPVCDADAEVHKLYAGAAVPVIEAAFPGTTADGRVDRQKLATVLIERPDQFARLEAIVHPLVLAAERDFLREQAAKGAKMAVLEVPLLLETGGDKRVDAVIVVSAPAEVQRRRVLLRPAMDPEKLEQMLARQLPDAEKRARADFVVDTGGTFAEADAQVDKIIESLQGRPALAFARFWA